MIKRAAGGAHIGQIHHAKERRRRARCDRLVAGLCLVKLPLKLVGVADLAHDVVRGRLGCRQRLNQGLVLEHVVGRLGHELEDAVLELLERLFVLCVLHDNVDAVLFELGPLLFHHQAEQLVLERVLRRHKVDQVDLCRHLGAKLWIAQLGRDVEPKVGCVLNHVITLMRSTTARRAHGEGSAGRTQKASQHARDQNRLPA